MSESPLYHFRKSRRQRARLFRNMAAMCWVYVAAREAFVRIGGAHVPGETRMAVLVTLPLASVVLLGVAWWHRRNPGVYEATITRERFTVRYPGSERWSFSVPLEDIRRFESRRELSHAGASPITQGIVLRDGRFLPITMNYGNHIGRMHKAVQAVRPEVEFPARVNQRTRGLGLDRDYAD